MLKRKLPLNRILILYHSAYGHCELMAQAVAEGVQTGAAHPEIRRVPELVSDEVARKAGFKMDQAAPVARVEELSEYDGIIIGTGTRFGRISSQMASFLDQCGGLWAANALVGKVGAAFTSTGTQHGGQETTLFSMITNMLHFGMIVVGQDYGFDGQKGYDRVHGGTPYGASTISGSDNGRMPSDIDLAGARYLGTRVARVCEQLHLR